MRLSTVLAVLLVLLVAEPIPAQQAADIGTVGDAVRPAESAPLYTKGALEGTLEPGEYVLGAGDVLQIGFWGDINRLETVTISPDGDILIAPVGPLHADGLTLSEVRELIRRELATYYRPSILSVSLVAIRSFQVHVVGVVTSPGAIEANAVTRVSQAITLAGGFATAASQRNIKVKRKDQVIPVDLARYFALGDNSMNPYLEGGDVVYVPPPAAWVEIYGSVHRPGRYEFVGGDKAGDIVDLAGGLRPEAYPDSVEIQRFTGPGSDVSESIFIGGGSAALEVFEIVPGDRIFIRAIPRWQEDAKVRIVGEVAYPGVYVVDEGVETLSDLVARAGGLTDMASLAEARLIRGTYSDTRFPIEAELDETRDLEGSFDEKDFDLIKTLAREPKGALSLTFESILLGTDGYQDPPLYNGDIIEIPSAVWYVRVSGHVRNPGLVAFKAGEGHGYYISQAGGLAPGADRWGTKLIRGLTGQRMKPGGEHVRPGDIIWIPRRPDRDWWSITKDILQVLAQVATIYVVADRITSE